MITGGKDGGRGSQGVWDGHEHPAVFNMENQQGPAGQHSKLYVCIRLSPFTDHLKPSQHC